jgi:protein SCO1/2
MKMKSKNSLKIAAALAFALFIGNSCGNKNESAPKLLAVYGSKTPTETDTIYHTIANFSLTNQDGEVVSGKTVTGKIYVANFFFATCQSICPEMSGNLSAVQQEFMNDDSLLILSHSVNPLHDTVAVLKNYAATYGAKSGKWHLLTGNKKMIYDLAKTSYLVNALEDDGTPEGFLHSELLLLIDGKGRIRGMYDGTDKAAIQELIAAIHLLKTEKAS